MCFPERRRNIGRELRAMPDATAAGRREETVHLGHPAERFGQRAAAVILAQGSDDLVEVFSFDRSRSAFLTLECRRHRFKEPQNFLHCLPRSLFEKKAVRLVERGVNKLVRALAQRFLRRLDDNRCLWMACQQGWGPHLIGHFMFIEDLVDDIGVREAYFRMRRMYLRAPIPEGTDKDRRNGADPRERASTYCLRGLSASVERSLLMLKIY